MKREQNTMRNDVERIGANSLKGRQIAGEFWKKPAVEVYSPRKGDTTMGYVSSIPFRWLPIKLRTRTREDYFTLSIWPPLRAPLGVDVDYSGKRAGTISRTRGRPFEYFNAVDVRHRDEIKRVFAPCPRKPR